MSNASILIDDRLKESDSLSLTEAFKSVGNFVIDTFFGRPTPAFARAADAPNAPTPQATLDTSAPEDAPNNGVTLHAVPDQPQAQRIETPAATNHTEQEIATTTSYAIQHGDTLYTIAKANGTTVAALMEANPSIEHEDRIQAGANIGIPRENPVGTGTTTATSIVTDVTEDTGIALSYQKSDAALEMQKNLAALGYDVGTIDGQPGPRTMFAVAEFQKDNAGKLTNTTPDFADLATLDLLERQASSLTPAAPEADDNNLEQGSQAETLAGVRAPLENMLITSKFDQERKHPTLKNPDGSAVIRPHNGIDLRTINQDTGHSEQSVLAAQSGTVTFAGWQNGYGNIVILDHGNGVESHYAHLSDFTDENGNTIQVGDTVARGEQIAISGNSGIGTTSHLDFGIKVGGHYVDPEAILEANSGNQIAHKGSSTNIQIASSDPAPTPMG